MEYSVDRRDHSQWRNQGEAQRKEQQEARYNELMNNSPAPSNPANRQTPASHLDNASTIASYEEDTWEETTYTVSEEEPLANVSCTNLLFGNGKKNSGLINCNRVNPDTTEVEVSINMPNMEHFEKGVDKYMDRVAPSESNLKSAMQAFHCKQDPIHSAQFAQYERYDYDEPSLYAQSQYHQPSQMTPMTPMTPMRRSIPTEVSALFSEGSCSSDEDEDGEDIDMAPRHRKSTPREIIVQNDDDAVSVLSDRYLVNMRVGHGRYSGGNFEGNYGTQSKYDTPKPLSPFNKSSAFSPSSKSKSFRDFDKKSAVQKPAMLENLDENGLKKDSESSSLFAVSPTDSAGEAVDRVETKREEKKEDKRFVTERKKKTLRVKREHSSFDESDDEPESHRKPQESAQDDKSDEYMGSSEMDIEVEFMSKQRMRIGGELVDSSEKDTEDKPWKRSLGMKSQNVLAKTGGTESRYSSSRRVYKDTEEYGNPLETSYDDRSIVSDAYSYKSYLETDNDEAKDMPSTRAAAALIETMMGTLNKQPLTRIAEESDQFMSTIEDLDFHSSDDSIDVPEPTNMKRASKDLYRYL
jgi:hypothetical protein